MCFAYRNVNGRYQLANPELKLNGDDIPYLHTAEFKYLGRWIAEDASETMVRQRIKRKICICLYSVSRRLSRSPGTFLFRVTIAALNESNPSFSADTSITFC